MKFTIATLFSTLLLSGVAFAADPLQPGGKSSAAPPFAQLDTDKDGALSKSEAAKVRNLDVNQADTDRDGKISQSEYEAAALRMGK
jgi:hypothetical protein